MIKQAAFLLCLLVPALTTASTAHAQNPNGTWVLKNDSRANADGEVVISGVKANERDYKGSSNGKKFSGKLKKTAAQGCWAYYDTGSTNPKGLLCWNAATGQWVWQDSPGDSGHLEPKPAGKCVLGTRGVTQIQSGETLTVDAVAEDEAAGTPITVDFEETLESVPAILDEDGDAVVQYDVPLSYTGTLTISSTDGVNVIDVWVEVLPTD